MSTRERAGRLEDLLERIKRRSGSLGEGETLSAEELAEIAEVERLLRAARALGRAEGGHGSTRAAESFDALERGNFRESLLDPSEVASASSPAIEVRKPGAAHGSHAAASELEADLGLAPASTQPLGAPLADYAFGGDAKEEPASAEMTFDLGGDFDRDFTGVREVPLPADEEADTPISVSPPPMRNAASAPDDMEVELVSQGAPGLYSPDLVASGFPSPYEEPAAALVEERFEGEITGGAVAVERGKLPAVITTFGELLDLSLLL